MKPQNTVKPLAALKSIWPKSSHQKKGLQSELRVIKAYQQQKWKLLFQRQKINKVEIDLIFYNPHLKLIHFLEVKTLDTTWRAFSRITKTQLLKLQKNLFLTRAIFETKNNKIKINGYVVFVSKNQKLQFVCFDDVHY